MLIVDNYLLLNVDNADKLVKKTNIVGTSNFILYTINVSM